MLVPGAWRKVPGSVYVIQLFCGLCKIKISLVTLVWFRHRVRYCDVLYRTVIYITVQYSTVQ